MVPPYENAQTQLLLCFLCVQDPSLISPYVVLTHVFLLELWMSEAVWVDLEEFVEGIDFVITDTATAVPADLQLETFRDYLEEQFEAEPASATEATSIATRLTLLWDSFYSIYLDTYFWSCCLRPLAHINEGVYQADSPCLFV